MQNNHYDQPTEQTIFAGYLFGLFGKKIVTGVTRYFVDGREPIFLSDADLAAEAEAARQAEEDEKARRKYDDALAAARKEGLKEGKTVGVKAAANVSPDLREWAIATAEVSEYTIGRTDSVIQRATIVRDEARKDFEAAKTVLDNLS